MANTNRKRLQQALLIGMIAAMLTAGTFFVFQVRAWLHQLTPVPDLHGDPLPPGAVARLGTTRFRHEASVLHTAFSPDGRLLATASQDGTVRLWDAKSGKELRRIEYGVRRPELPWFGGTLVFSPDGKMFGLARYELAVWDTATGNEVAGLQGREDVGDYMTMRFLRGGEVAAVARDKQSLRLFRLRTGKEVHRFAGVGRFQAAVLSPDGKILAALDQDNNSRCFLRLWDTATGKALRSAIVFENHTGGVAFAPDGRTLVVSETGRVHVYETATGKETASWITSVFGCVTFSPDGKMVAVGNNYLVDVWEVASRRKRRSFRCFQWGNSIAFAPDGKTLAAGSGYGNHRMHPALNRDSGTVQVWNLSTGRLHVPIDAHEQAVLCVDFSRDGKHLVSGGRDHTVRLWQAKTGKQVRVFRAHDNEISAVAFVPRRPWVASASHDSTVRVWHAGTGAVVHTLRHETNVQCLACSPDGMRLATAASGKICVWNTATGKQVQQWTKVKPLPIALMFSPNGRNLAWGGGQRVFLPDGGDNSIILADVATGKIKRTLPKESGLMAVCSLAFAPDGQALAAGYMNTKLRLWQPATGKLLRALTTRAESQVVFSPNGKTLASCGALSSTVTLFETATGIKRRVIDTRQGGVHGMAFSPDSRYIATAGADSTIMVWDTVKH